MTCTDCGQDTLTDGVCGNCFKNRIDNYSRLKEANTNMKSRLAAIKELLKAEEHFLIEKTQFYQEIKRLVEDPII